MKKAAALLFALGLAGLVPATAHADSYKSDSSDHPFRIIAYPVHAVGKGIEYVVMRPIHSVASQPKLRYIFGHSSNPRRDDQWGDWDQYQRSNY